MPGHDVDVRRILWAAAAIALGVAMAVLAVLALLRRWDIPARVDAVRQPDGMVVGAPRLQSAPQVEVERYRAQKQRQLESSAWVDAEHGIVRIPIAQAMALLARPAASAASQAKARP